MGHGIWLMLMAATEALREEGDEDARSQRVLERVRAVMLAW